MSYFRRWIEIKSYKHDGKLHRIWDRGLVLEDNEDFIVVASKRAKVVESNGRKWFTKEPAVTIFSKKEWYNVICMLKSEGVTYYCNIASPALVEKNTIKYIDYDLDIKLFANNSIKVLDEKEYQNHKRFYDYSKELDKVLKYELANIRQKMEARKFPFSDNKIVKFYQYFEEALKEDK